MNAKVRVLSIAVLLAFPWSTEAHGELMGTQVRTPQFPLKTGRTLVTDAQLEQARKNIEQYPSARAQADSVVAKATKWLEWTDDELRNLIPTADVPRAFNVGTEGCPECGKEIYERGGFYPWILDPRKPFKVECPVDGSVYPSNDFAAYYRSGMEDQTKLDGPYADDGWGWVGPDGERYWFVGYANHWIWRNHVIAALQYLGRAYLLTDDPRFAHTAAVMLDRIAEVYPGMDYHNQSRYGQLTEAAGGHYGGKIVNLIWETRVLACMAESYDAIWETIDGDTVLHELADRDGPAIRAYIEANILEEGIDAIFAEEIRGNFGMHQRALVYATLARQHGKTQEWFDELFDRSDMSHSALGLNYALFNLVFRDGMPFETSPGYCFSWVSSITSIAEALRKADMEAYDVYRIPKTKRLYDVVLDMHNIRLFTPSLGDSGSVYGGKVGANATIYQAAYRAYQDPRYLRHLATFNATGDAGFNNYETLSYPAIEAASAEPPPQPSRLLDGYGMAILNNPKDSVSVALYYGQIAGHGHLDRLHFELFANAQPMMPDEGYPDFMNAYVPGIVTWSKNTIAHNTVAVDASMQKHNIAGTVHAFVDGSFARLVDVDAPGTYAQCSLYRRHLMMIDVDDDRSYFMDVFNIEGGDQHDYSLHGPPGTFQALGGSWRDQPKGTLAGEDVAIGEIYDDPVRGAEGFEGSYYGYYGSGFQHLFNVQRSTEGEWCGEWAHEKDPAARLRIRLLNTQDHEAILADAQVSPIKHKQLLKFVIARRQGKDLKSRFAAIVEPYNENPFILKTRCVELTEGTGLAVIVTRDDGFTDILLYDPERSAKRLAGHGISTDAASALVTLDASETPVRVFFVGGRELSVGEQRFETAVQPEGEVFAVEPLKGEIRIRLNNAGQNPAPEAIVGRAVHFENALRRTAHPVTVARVEDDVLVVTVRDEMRVGRARITAIEEGSIKTDTTLPFRPLYRGAVACDPDFKQYYRIAQVDEGLITLVAPLPESHPFEIGADLWIVNVGPGDQLDVPTVFSWERDETDE